MAEQLEHAEALERPAGAGGFQPGDGEVDAARRGSPRSPRAAPAPRCSRPRRCRAPRAPRECRPAAWRSPPPCRGGTRRRWRTAGARRSSPPAGRAGCRRSRAAATGHQIVVPGTGASSTTWVRVEIHTPCTSDRPTPIATPVGTGSRITAAAVTAISANSPGAWRATVAIVPRWHDAHCHEQQQAGQRRMRHLGEHAAAGQRQRRHHQRRQQRRGLRGAARLVHDRGARRAGIDREAAEQRRADIGRAQPDEVAVDVGALAAGETSD